MIWPSNILKRWQTKRNMSMSRFWMGLTSQVTWTERGKKWEIPRFKTRIRNWTEKLRGITVLQAVEEEHFLFKIDEIPREIIRNVPAVQLSSIIHSYGCIMWWTKETYKVTLTFIMVIIDRRILNDSQNNLVIIITTERKDINM